MLSTNNEKEKYFKRFVTALDKLNSEQRKAVETIEGPVVVVAGPGTGKTQILTLRIANIINKLGSDYASNILALTFTNAGVLAMRQRLVEFIGVKEAYEVGIYTFHAFADEQIKNNPEFFPQFLDSRPLSDVERMQIIDQLLEEGDWSELTLFSSHDHATRDVAEAINDLKMEAITPESFSKTFDSIAERVIANTKDPYYKRQYKTYKAGDLKPTVEQKILKQTARQKELLKLYEQYQEILSKRKLYDFSDMILSVVKTAEENNDFLQSLQEEYLYILIDEHQDTNSAQNRLVELMVSASVNEGSPNIFTVGDEKQAIYRFQGASVENFEKFKTQYRDTKVIGLKSNYRSSQKILDSSHSVMPTDIKLQAKHKEFADLDLPVQLVELDDNKSELIFLARSIKRKIKSGINPQEIAVFCKENREIDEVRDILEKFKVPYNISSKEDILDSKEIKNIILLLETIYNPYDDERLSRVLFLPWFSLPTIDVLKILEKFKIRQEPIMKNKSLLKIISDSYILKGLEVENPAQFLDLADLLLELKAFSEQEDLVTFFEEFIVRTKILHNLLTTNNSAVSLFRLEKIFTEVKTQAVNNKEYKLKNFLNYLHILRRYNLRIEVPKINLDTGVNLMTAHGAKGLEFEYVYVFNFIDSKWGGKKTKGKTFILPTNKITGGIDDEKRLFYVVLTRAKKEICLTYARFDDEGKEKTVSRLLSEIDDNFVVKITEPKLQMTDKLNLYFSPKTKTKISAFNLNYIRKVFLETPLSVTALNNYLQSPLKYLFVNLLKMPTGQNKILLFGNIIHKTLEDFFILGQSSEKTPSLKQLLEIFDYSLQHFNIPEKYFSDIENHGREVLSKYYERYKDEFNFAVETEKKVYTQLILPGGDHLRLYGIIDKIEILDNRRIQVVDYKTGKPYSQKTKEQKSYLDRQLAFYKFLLDKFYNDNRVEKVKLDFVEPKRDSGEFECVCKSLTKEEVKKVEQEIFTLADDVLSGNLLKREYKKNKDNEDYFDLWEDVKDSIKF